MSGGGEKQKRIRSINWDEEEKQLFRSIFKEYSHIIENKSLNTNATKAKTKAWETVHKKFNELNSKQRDLQQLQNQWKHMKINARKVCSSYNKELRKTGGGEGPPMPNQDVMEIKDIMNPAELLRDHNEHDSDGSVMPAIQFLEMGTSINEMGPSTSAMGQSTSNIGLNTREELEIQLKIFDKEFKENKEFPQQMLETPKNSSLERATAKSKNSLKIGKSNLTEGAAAKVSKDEEYIKNITEYSRELKEKEHNRHMEIMELQHNRQMRYMRLKHEMEKREHEIKMKVQAELLKHASLKTKMLKAESQNK